MSFTNKTFDFDKKDVTLYNIDEYNVASGPALTINNKNNVVFRNTNVNRNTDNFYGDGRLGKYTKRDTRGINPPCFYFRTLEKDHELYGVVLLDCVLPYGGDLKPKDEVILYKKHARTNDQIDEVGEWYLSIIKERIEDEDGVHYSLEMAPSGEFTSDTANSCTLVYQFESLFVAEDSQFLIKNLGNYDHAKLPWWDDDGNGNCRNLTNPRGILYIKSRTSIKLDPGSILGSNFGYAGVHYYSYDSTKYEYSLGSGPLGSGCIGNHANDDVFDPSCMKPYKTYLQSGGSFGEDGIAHEEDTKYRNQIAKSDDLNDRIYNGIGGSCYYGYKNYNHFGTSGGGIVIIQTPYLEFADDSCQVTATGEPFIRNDGLGYGNGGSILVKARTIHFNKAIDLPMGDSATDILTVKPNFNTIIVTQPGDDVIFGLSGQVQLECDTYRVVDDFYSNDDFDDYKENYIADFYYKDFLYNKNVKDDYDMTDHPQYKERNEDHKFMSPVYENDYYFCFYTAGLKNIIMGNWYEIIKFATNFEIPTVTDSDGTRDVSEIRMLFSINSGDSWYYFDMESNPPKWTASSTDQDDLKDKSNTVQQMKDFEDYNLLTSAFIGAQRDEEIRTIDVLFALKTDEDHITPILDNLLIDYNEPPVVSAPVPIRPFNGQEFDNEFVNFVWLQPYQKYGSIQNRIEVSPNPYFEEESLLIEANADYSTTNNQIVLPYIPSSFDNSFSKFGEFRFPYMLKRSDVTHSTYEKSYPSIVNDSDNKKIVYNANDLYTRKGKMFNTVAANIDYPGEGDDDSKLDCTIMNSDKDYTPLIHFHYGTDTDDHGDGAYVTEVTVGSEIFDDGNTIHGTIKKWNNSDDAYIDYKLDGEKNDTNPLLDRSKACTITIRFKLEDIPDVNQVVYLYELYYESSTSISSLTMKKILLNGREVYVLKYDRYKGTYTTVIEPCYVQQETIITLMVDDDNNIRCVINGKEVYMNCAFIYTDYNTNVSDDGKQFHLKIGSHRSNGYTFIGNIIEFAVFDPEEFTETDVFNQQVPVFQLRYSIEDNTINWLRIPYKDHLSEYQIKDFNHYSTKTELEQYSFAEDKYCSYRSDIYKSNNESLLLGTYLGGVDYKEAFVFENQVKHYIEGLNGIVVKDSSSYEVKTTNNNSYYIERNLYNTGVRFYDTKKMNIETDSIKMDFYYKGNQIKEYNPDASDTTKTGIIMGCGLMYSDDIIFNTDSYTNRRFRITEDALGKWYLHVRIRNSSDSEGTYKDDVLLDIKLRAGNFYSLDYITGADQTDWKLVLSSRTDNNYFEPYVITDSTDSAYPTPGCRGSSEPVLFDEETIGNDYTTAFVQDDTYYNCNFDIISLNTYDSSSEQQDYAGYTNSYEIVEYIDNYLLDKLNNVLYNVDIPDTASDVRFMFMFNDKYTTYDVDDKEWKEIDEFNYSDAMTLDEVVNLNTDKFNNTGGYDGSNDFKIKVILLTEDYKVTPKINSIRVNYNGPRIIDSWIDTGSFYENIPFYYNKGVWSPYQEPDFSDDDQEWLDNGTGVPNPLLFEDGHGSKPSGISEKVYGGVRLLLKPKGKYYWRVAAYNGN